MKLKSIVSAALILSMTAGIAGCGLQRSETDPTTTTTAATTPTKKVSTTMQPKKATTDSPKTGVKSISAALAILALAAGSAFAARMGKRNDD